MDNVLESVLFYKKRGSYHTNCTPWTFSEANQIDITNKSILTDARKTNLRLPKRERGGINEFQNSARPTTIYNIDK